jgi:hypothetical protein
VQKSADAMTIDSTCNIAGKTAKTHAEISGSFDSAYKMTVTSQGEGTPGNDITLSLEAKWLGPCGADQKPGDLVMGNGMKLNILRTEAGRRDRSTDPVALTGIAVTTKPKGSQLPRILNTSRRGLLAAALSVVLPKPLLAQGSAAGRLIFPADFVWGASTSNISN